MCTAFFQAHISSQNTELTNAALQALGFCVFNSNTTSELPGKQTNFSVDAGSVCVSVCLYIYLYLGVLSLCLHYHIL